MAEATFTFRVEDRLKSAFSDAARARDRTGAQLLRDFMRDYVTRQREKAEYDALFRRQIEAGLEAANAGRLIPAAEVEAEFAGRTSETLGKLNTSSR